MEDYQKIIVLGLDNAGKSSLLTEFGGHLGIEDLASLEPTRGVHRQEIKTEDLKFLIWDFGGQEDHRSEYLEEPEEYFLGATVIIYVIDLLDPNRYEESISYFQEILYILQKLEEDPQILIFIHKYDPELQKRNEVLSNIKKIRNLIEAIIKKTDLTYEIYLTSIYSTFPNQPKFVNLVQEIIEGKQIDQGTIEINLNRITDILGSTMNAVIELSSSIIGLEDRIKNLEQILESGRVLKKERPKIDIEDLKPSKIGKLKREDIKIQMLSQMKNVIIDKEEN